MAEKYERGRAARSWAGFRRSFREKFLKVWPDWFLVSCAFLALTCLPLLAYILVAILANSVSATAADASGANLRNLILAFASVIGAPFIFWRTLVAHWQAQNAEHAQVTDRINKAVDGLGSDKVVKVRTRLVFATREAGDEALELVEYWGEAQNLPAGYRVAERSEWRDGEETRPNIEVRIGAIHALERISQDSPRDHVTVMKILCAYIRENAPAENAQPLPQGIWEMGAPYPLEAVKDWARTLPAPRTDIQTALTVIGRRSQELRKKEADASPAYRLDLRRTNLQRADRARLDLDNAFLREARLQGANLMGTRLERSDLGGAGLQVANLMDARAELANLNEARLQGAHLDGARLSGASLVEARLQRASLWGTQMESAQLPAARLQGAMLMGAQLQGATLEKTRLQVTTLSGAQLVGANLGWARLQGSDLEGAQMQRALLRSVKLDGTRLSAGLQCAALISVDLTKVSECDPATVQSAFGDGSVALPDGDAWERPAHWADDQLTDRAFQSRWRGWCEHQGMHWPPAALPLFNSVTPTPPGTPVSPDEIASGT